MKLTKQNKSKDGLRLAFTIDGASEAFVNSVRRLIVEEVPTLAIEDLEIKENNSALYDEMLALRLGLTPIKTDLSSYSLPKSQEEIDERAASCTLQFTLKAAKKGYVYASEAKSKDPSCTFVHEKMPVAKLGTKQKIDLIMWAVMGQGKDHIKWSPGLAWFKQEADVKVNNEAVEFEDFKSKFPSQIFDTDGKISEKKIIELDLIDAVDRVNEKIVQVTYKPNTFTFNLESWGQLSTNDILSESANILVKKVEELEALI